jgi:hypothetical protein
MQLKMFARPYWYQTKSYIETISDSSRREPRVVVGRDSSAWISFSALKSNRRQIFLSRVKLSYIVDGQLSDAREKLSMEYPAFARLMQNYPNPFNPTTTIGFEIPRSSFVTLKVFDLLGREVATLVNGEVKTGIHERAFDGSGLASGVYLYRLQAEGFVQTKKLLLLR